MNDLFDPLTWITKLLVLAIAFPLHEFAHAYVADQLGDPTPRRDGRITLDMRAHLDILGTILFLFSGFGWAKPVMTNPYNYRMNPNTGLMLVSVAGPFANLIIALVTAIPLRLDLLQFLPADWAVIVDNVLRYFIFFNLFLMLFNLLPIMPLDGAKILRGFAPREWDGWLTPFEQYGPMILMALVFLGSSFLFQYILYPPLFTLFYFIVG